MHSPGMQPSSFHDFLGCREGFGFLAEDCLPHLRGSATSIAPVGCAVDNADRDIVQQEAAAFLHCHDVPAVPISLYSSRFEFFFKRILNFYPFLSNLLFAIFITNAHALPGQLDVGSGPVKI